MEMSARVIVHSVSLRKEAAPIVRQRLKAAMHEACAYGKRKVKERTPQGVYGAQGGLMGSIQFEVRPFANGITGIIGTASPYGMVVEKGRSAGSAMPPTGTMLRWMEVKMGMSEEEAIRKEFVVRRAIGRKGTKGAEMFTKLLTEDRSALDAIFDRHGFKLTTELGAP